VLLQAILFSCVAYWMMGFENNAGKFFWCAFGPCLLGKQLAHRGSPNTLCAANALLFCARLILLPLDAFGRMCMSAASRARHKTPAFYCTMPQHTCFRGAHKFLFIIYPTLNLILLSLRNRFLFIIYLTLNLMAFYGIMGVYITPNLVVASVLSGFFYGASFLSCVQPFLRHGRCEAWVSNVSALCAAGALPLRSQ